MEKAILKKINFSQERMTETDCHWNFWKFFIQVVSEYVLRDSLHPSKSSLVKASIYIKRMPISRDRDLLRVLLEKA